ncbi:MAG: twin-arginine translocase TatA/TatE family subunit [Chloroflexi bacterium]|nr:twin-arginine translocase TatA/TatE family subunit [Chloroflexota bacterium]
MFIKSPSTDLIIVLVIVLLIFGPKRLPGLGKQLGQGMREFKDSITGNSKDDDEAESRPELTSATASAPEAPSAPAAQREPASHRPV